MMGNEFVYINIHQENFSKPFNYSDQMNVKYLMEELFFTIGNFWYLKFIYIPIGVNSTVLGYLLPLSLWMSLPNLFH